MNYFALGQALAAFGGGFSAASFFGLVIFIVSSGYGEKIRGKSVILGISCIVAGIFLGSVGVYFINAYTEVPR